MISPRLADGNWSHSKQGEKMLIDTLNYLKEIDIEAVSREVESYCCAVEIPLPKKIRVKIELARRLVESDGKSPEFEELSVYELNTIKKTIQRANELMEYSDRFKAFRDLIFECNDNVPDAKLNMVAKDLSMRFSPELLLGESLSPYALDARCENFANDYQSVYIIFHNQWHDERRRNETRLENLSELAKTLDTLNSLLDVDSGAEGSWRTQVEKIANLPKCGILVSHKLGYAPFCPECKLRYCSAFKWEELPMLEEKITNMLEKRQTQISRKLADDLVKRSPDDPLTGLVEAITVSDLSKLPKILTDDVVKALKKVLG